MIRKNDGMADLLFNTTYKLYDTTYHPRGSQTSISPGSRLSHVQ
jgi:hypothetical protein